MSTPSLALIPSGYKADKVYSVLPANGDGDFDFTRGSTATRVNKDGIIETVGTNVPRLDYTNSECPSLLLEPQRTQLAGYPTAITSANSYVLTNGTLTANDSTAPDGSLTASTFQSTSANGQFQKLKSASSGVQYSVSVYVKRKTGTGTVYLRAVENTNTAVTVTDEWTRVSATVTSTSTNVRFGMALATSGDEIFVWGFQVEAGSYPTSFIPNADDSEVTRTVDVSKKENFADMPTDYPFTVYSNNKVDLINFNQWAWSILDISSSVKYLGLAFTNSGYIQLHRRNSNNDIDSIITTVTQGQDFKFAITFLSDTSYRYSINGGATVTVTGGAIVDFDFNDILIGQQRVVVDTGYRNTSNDFRILNENVTSSELTELTS